MQQCFNFTLGNKITSCKVPSCFHYLDPLTVINHRKTYTIFIACKAQLNHGN